MPNRDVKAIQIIRYEKMLTQTSVHASKERILCRGINCGVEFFPKRKTQVFCSSKCRINYFSIARALGVVLLERRSCDPGLRVLVDRLLKILKDFNEIKTNLLEQRAVNKSK